MEKLTDRSPRTPPAPTRRYLFRCNVGHEFAVYCSPDPPEGRRCIHCDATAVPIGERTAVSPKQKALDWLRKELVCAPGKCPLCNVIHAALCPQEDWLSELLASYALDCEANHD